MKVTFLGQAGLLFQNDVVTILVDPYLSDSVAKIEPKNSRRQPIDDSFFDLKPNIIICTHNHLDHIDMETLENYLNTDEKIEILSPQLGWEKLRQYGKNHNYILFNRHTTWTYKNISITAVKAEHSDVSAIGVIIDDGSDKFYITGDTLYNSEIFADLPNDIDILFLPINGVGNNMNMKDAEKFAQLVGAKKVVPIHWGMFDSLNPEDFICENIVIPTIYEVINL